LSYFICSRRFTQFFLQSRNYGREPQDVRIYQTDYAFTFDGKSYYDPPGKAPRSNASWIVINHKRMTIPGASHADVRFSVKVPDDPNLVGTYWSVIMVEGVPKAPAAPPGAPQKESSVAITQVVRYAVQIVTQIGDSGSLQLKFLKTELFQDNGRKTLRIDVENTGERGVRPVASLELYRQNGELAGKFEGERLRIYPGTSVRFSFDVSRLAEGRYKALVVLDNKDSHVFGAQYTLDLTL
jgi:urease beta subunit